MARINRNVVYLEQSYVIFQQIIVMKYFTSVDTYFVSFK